MTVGSSPCEDILEDERRWDEVSQQILGHEAMLIAVSRFVGDSRVYGLGDEVAKVRRNTGPSPVRTMATEAGLMKRAGVTVRHLGVGEFEALVMRRVRGRSLEAALPELSFAQRIAALRRLTRPLARLHRRGIAHRDLRPDNVLLDEDGSVRLVDFDRAVPASTFAALAADWAGIGSGQVPWPFWKLAIATLSPRTISLARRVRDQVRPTPPVILCEPSDEVIARLVDAWSVAAHSPANAPGHRVAYYAFTFHGVHLLGERPWYLRWDRIRGTVDFRGKRLLELGCNMGLLSTFAMIHGAASAVGVDRDAEIVRSAGMAAAALGVEPRFEQVDLVQDSDWETRLAGADIVAAMSLLHWLPDPDRLLRFLGTHREVIYEGHDSADVEIGRLRSVGFTHFEVLPETERGRPLLLASRD